MVETGNLIDKSVLSGLGRSERGSVLRPLIIDVSLVTEVLGYVVLSGALKLLTIRDY